MSNDWAMPLFRRFVKICDILAAVVFCWCALSCNCKDPYDSAWIPTTLRSLLFLTPLLEAMNLPTLRSELGYTPPDEDLLSVDLLYGAGETYVRFILSIYLFVVNGQSSESIFY